MLQQFIWKVFTGNTKDRRTPVTNQLDPPIIAYSIKIHPEEWHGAIAMRVGLYGCTSGEVQKHLMPQTEIYFLTAKANLFKIWLALTRG